MAPRKKADEKSMQLAAAAVGAGTEPVSAQAEPKKDGVLVDPAAEDARLEAEQQAAEEARLAAEAAAAAATTQDGTAGDQGSANALGESSEPGANLAEELDRPSAALVMGADDSQPDWLLGQFDVKSRPLSGFWRCGVHFLRSSYTRVFIVTDKDSVPPEHECEITCCYLTADDAQRVYSDIWLDVSPYSLIVKD